MKVNDSVMKFAGNTVLLGKVIDHQVIAKCNRNGWQFIHVDWSRPGAHDLICSNMKDPKVVRMLTAGQDWIRSDQVVKIDPLEMLGDVSALCRKEAKEFTLFHEMLISAMASKIFSKTSSAQK